MTGAASSFPRSAWERLVDALRRGPEEDAERQDKKAFPRRA